MSSVSVALWGLLAALDHALDPSIRHPLLALWSRQATWFFAEPFQPYSGFSRRLTIRPIFGPFDHAPLNQPLYCPVEVGAIHTSFSAISDCGVRMWFS